MVEIKRGQVWTGNLNPTRGNETGKIRPVLIIQDNALTDEGFDTVIILPLTTQIRPGLKNFRVTIPARDRLLQQSQVIIERPRALDRKRFGEGPLTALSADEMTAVERGLLAVMGMASYLPDL